MFNLSFLHKLAGSPKTLAEDLTNWAPTILERIISVEQAAHGLPGQAKLEIVINTILAGAQAVKDVPVPSVQSIASLVTLFVGVLNSVGVFHHGGSAPAPVVPVALPVAA
jgi:hypothetical protein